MRRHPSQKGRLRRRGPGFWSPSLGLWGRWRLLREPRAGFQAGLLRPATKVAVALFVVFDLILVYRLTATDPPIAGGAGGTGAYSAPSATVDELRQTLADLNVRVSALNLFGGDAGRGTHHSTKRTGGDIPQETTPSSGYVANSGTTSSASSSGSGSSTSGSGSGGSGTGSSGGSTDEGGPGGGGLPGDGSGGGGTGGGGGGGGG